MVDWNVSTSSDNFRVLLRILAERLKCSPMARETWVQSQVKSYQRLKKWYLMPPCLTLSIIRYGSRVNWSNPGKGVAPFPSPWCSSYRKGSLRFSLDYGRQLYFLLHSINSLKSIFIEVWWGYWSEFIARMKLWRQFSDLAVSNDLLIINTTYFFCCFCNVFNIFRHSQHRLCNFCCFILGA